MIGKPDISVPHDRACEYCGLPLGAGRLEPEPGRYFCCYGCYLVQRIVGEQDEAGVAAWVLTRLGVGAFLAMNVMMISLVLYTDAPKAMTAQTIRALHWALLGLSAPALLVMGVPFLRSAWLSGVPKPLLRRGGRDRRTPEGSFGVPKPLLRRGGRDRCTPEGSFGVPKPLLRRGGRDRRTPEGSFGVPKPLLRRGGRDRRTPEGSFGVPKPLLRRGGRDRRTPEAAAETAALQKTQRRLNVDALIAMGAFSAFGVSAYHVLHGEGPVYFDTAAMLLVLVTVGKLLEASAKSHTSRLVRGLLSLGSRVAHRLTDAGEEDVAPAEIQPGDRVAVRPGEQVPVDGVVRSGSSSVQEATFTGEPQPRPGGPGDRVYGGSVNTDGRLVVEATGVGEDTLLGQMVRLVREAQARRAPVERLADRLAAVFVPLVWVIALGSAGYWTLLRQNWEPAGMAALSVLVVACPCALGLATPLAVSLAIGRAARAGVLVRSGETLERLPRLRRLFADKTGTLTRGTLSLTAIAVLDDPPQPPLRKGGGIPLLASLPQKEDHVLAWTATLESASEHPVAQAIVEAARQRGLALGQVQDFRAIPGHGAEGTVTLGGEQRTLAVGTARFLADRGLAWPEQTPTHPHTPHGEDHSRVFVAWDGRVQARFDLADHARPEAAGVVAELAAQGVQTVLLSGDREEAARRLAQEVGIAEVYAPCNPADKVAVIEAARQSGSLHPLFPLPPPLSPRRLGSYGIAMIGDGLNDAPALAAADVGIALAGGTDLAREAGDVVLLGDELRRLPWLIDLARKSYRIIAQNLFWAFGYNAVALTLAFFGRLHPLLAAVLMLFSSLFVLGNSLRLVRDP